MIYRSIVDLRKLLYKYQILKTHKFEVPIIIVGNLTIGGTGKTPMVYYLANYFKTCGLKPAVVMRGYRSKKRSTSHIVSKDSDPKIFGDEPVMLANNLECPVVIGKDRVQTIKLLLNKYSVDIIICDDGLQHYKLKRDLEILMIDGERYLGNLHCLPLGPLRESLSKINKVDIIMVTKIPNDHDTRSIEHQAEIKKTHLIDLRSKLFYLKLDPQQIYNLKNKKEIQDPNFFNLVHAVAGIGNNQRFFNLLNYLGIHTINHAFPDHHQYKLVDLYFNDDLPIIMTEKDAIKCKDFARSNFWYLKIKPEVEAEEEFHQHLGRFI